MLNYCIFYHTKRKETNPNVVHFGDTKQTLSLTSRQNTQILLANSSLTRLSNDHTSHAQTTRFRILQFTNNTFFSHTNLNTFIFFFVLDNANKTQLFKHKRISWLSSSSFEEVSTPG